jgi:hypothetical protein
MLLGSFFDEVAVKTELADQRIDLPESQRWFRCALQVSAYEAIVESLHFQSSLFQCKMSLKGPRVSNAR